MKNHHCTGECETKEQCCKNTGMRGKWGMYGYHHRKFHKLVRLVFFLTIIFFFPWNKINWGTVNLGSQSTISITGSAEGTQKNQIANFSASVTIENTDKETAVQEVNTKMTDLITKLKEFGIEEDDLETQGINTSETYIDDEATILSYPPQRNKGKKGWRSSNSISITLRDIDKASNLTNLLNESGATNIYGPNFRVDDINELEKELLQQALDDAKEKAESMLAKSGQRVGKIIRLSEGSGGNYRTSGLMMDAMLPEAGGRVPAPIEPGSQKITKNVTVVFEITR